MSTSIHTRTNSVDDAAPKAALEKHEKKPSTQQQIAVLLESLVKARKQYSAASMPGVLGVNTSSILLAYKLQRTVAELEHALHGLGHSAAAVDGAEATV